MGRHPQVREPVCVTADGVLVPLTQGKATLIDAADAGPVLSHLWVATYRAKTNTWYAYRGIPGTKRCVLLHRAILDAPEGMQVDHANGDGLDNRRANLRLATRGQNNQNTRKLKHGSSQFKGVTWHSSAKKWRAKIQPNRQDIHLGFFVEEEAAARAYDAAARDLFGEFARLNFPEVHA